MGAVWHGIDEVMGRLTALSTEAAAAARAGITGAASIVEAAAKRNFEGAHAKGQPHTGGAKPNIVTGNLRRSIITEPVERLGFATFATRVGPTTIYARRVELGYPGGAGPGHQATRAFPYFRPAVEGNRARIEAFTESTWARFLR